MFNASGICLKPDHGKVPVPHENTHRKITWYSGLANGPHHKLEGVEKKGCFYGIWLILEPLLMRPETRSWVCDWMSWPLRIVTSGANIHLDVKQTYYRKTYLLSLHTKKQLPSWQELVSLFSMVIPVVLKTLILDFIFSEITPCHSNSHISHKE